MELYQLRQFKTIIETGNMSQAAQALYISQPALSQSLAKLEKELGTNLFDRHKNRLILNETGRKVLRHVDHILSEIESIYLVTASQSSFTSHLRLSSYEDPSLRYFGAIISMDFPGILLETSLKPDTEIVEDLKNGHTDIAFSASPVRHKDVFTTYLCSTRLFVSVPPGHELFNHDVLTWEDLDGQTFLIPAGYSYLFERIEAVEKERNIKIKRMIQKDFGLYRSMVGNSSLLHFSSNLDRLYTKNSSRKEIPVIRPGISIRYYASCSNPYTSALLPYMTCIQKFYWNFEDSLDETFN